MERDSYEALKRKVGGTKGGFFGAFASHFKNPTTANSLLRYTLACLGSAVHLCCSGPCLTWSGSGRRGVH